MTPSNSVRLIIGMLLFAAPHVHADSSAQPVAFATQQPIGVVLESIGDWVDLRQNLSVQSGSAVTINSSYMNRIPQSGRLVYALFDGTLRAFDCAKGACTGRISPSASRRSLPPPSVIDVLLRLLLTSPRKVELKTIGGVITKPNDLPKTELEYPVTYRSQIMNVSLHSQELVSLSQPNIQRLPTDYGAIPIANWRANSRHNAQQFVIISACASATVSVEALTVGHGFSNADGPALRTFADDSIQSAWRTLTQGRAHCEAAFDIVTASWRRAGLILDSNQVAVAREVVAIDCQTTPTLQR